MGHDCKGLNGEVGVYVYSSRYSKLVKTYPVRSASAKEAADTLDKFCVGVLPFMGEPISCFQTDAGTQFMSREWADICYLHKKRHRTCPVDHQAMNGQVERVLGLLASKTRALLHDSRLDKSFWPFAMDVAAYLLNRLPHDGIDGLSPIEKSTGNKPDLSRLRIFGCKAYVKIPKTL